MHPTLSPAAFSWNTCAVFLFGILLLSGCINDQELEFNPVLNIPPTCTDGLKNQDETAVDCGGACSEICGEQILAPCSAELEPNVVFSENEDHLLQITDVLYSSPYSSSPLLEVWASDKETGSEVSLMLPLNKLPAGNMKFHLAKELEYGTENAKATITIIPDYGWERVSLSGTLYLRTEGDETVHLEFCDVLFQPSNSWYDQTYYRYQGNIRFRRSDTEY